VDHYLSLSSTKYASVFASPPSQASRCASVQLQHSSRCLLAVRGSVASALRTTTIIRAVVLVDLELVQPTTHLEVGLPFIFACSHSAAWGMSNSSFMLANLKQPTNIHFPTSQASARQVLVPAPITIREEVSSAVVLQTLLRQASVVLEVCLRHYATRISLSVCPGMTPMTHESETCRH
jgi:hypothetical protein